MLAVRGKEAVEACQTRARWRDQRREAAQKLHGREAQELRRTGRGMLDAVQDLAILGQRQAPQGQGRTSAVTSQPLERIAVKLVHKDAGMQREALAEYAQALRRVVHRFAGAQIGDSLE